MQVGERVPSRHRSPRGSAGATGAGAGFAAGFAAAPLPGGTCAPTTRCGDGGRAASGVGFGFGCSISAAAVRLTFDGSSRRAELESRPSSFWQSSTGSMPMKSRKRQPTSAPLPFDDARGARNSERLPTLAEEPIGGAAARGTGVTQQIC